jgi:dihydropteroate synthase
MIFEMSLKGNVFSTNLRLNCRGKELRLHKPCVMGILNITPDSFYDGGRYDKPKEAIHQVAQMIEEGASIIDIGAVSTRPGSQSFDEEVELTRLLPFLEAIRDNFPEIIISVDTFRSTVARKSLDYGADMINDIYAGTYDPDILSVVSAYEVPYILMHMKGTPGTMQISPDYEKDVTDEILNFFENRIDAAKTSGISQLIIDPGFGFGKTLQHNYKLLKDLTKFGRFSVPVMAGVSRKSLINNVLGIKSSQALNGTTVLNTLALMNGASILRVHDVKPAMEAIMLCEQYAMNPG